MIRVYELLLFFLLIVIAAVVVVVVALADKGRERKGK